MIKPNGYDEARVSGERTQIRLGGHYCVIKQVSEKKSSTGKDMIVVLLDFDQNDDQAGLFKARFDGDDRDDKKWPFAGSKYIMVNDYNDPSKTSSSFKTFCSVVEKCNNFEIKWGDNWGAQFKGKKIGAVYGNEESEYEGRRSMRPIVRWWCKLDAVEGATVPEDKLLPESTAKPAASNSDGWENIAANIADEEIPF